MPNPVSVPLYPPGGDVAPAPLPGPRFSGPSANDLGAVGAAQTQAFGAELENFGRQQAMLQNQVRVNDAMNQARQKALDLTYDPKTGYTTQLGKAALERQSGVALTDEYGDKLSAEIAKISAGLTPQQQRVFNEQSAPILTNFRGDTQKFTVAQSHAYALSVQDSTQKLSEDQAGQQWSNPEAINGEGGLVAQAKAAVYATGKLTGMDVQAGMFASGSRIHAKVIDAALENGNPIYATGYLRDHSKEMTSDDILHVQGRVNSAADAHMAVLATDGARQQFQAALSPSDSDRLASLMAPIESGGAAGTDFRSDGTPVTSPKGAKYAMQVEPATSRAPGFGIKPADESGTPQQVAAEYNRVGKQYISALLQKYGSTAQALAAYNAGPARVDQAIADSKAAGEPGIWLQALPKETQTYVATILPKYESGAGAPPPPTEQAFVDAAVGALGPNPRPTALQLTTQRAEQQFRLMTQERAANADQALRDAQQALIANGGDFAAFQRDNPDIARRLSQFDPGKVDDAMKFSKAIAHGENETSPDLYSKLAAYPQEMAKMTDAQFLQLRAQLSEADFKHFATERGDIISGKTNNTAESIDSTTLNSVLKERLVNIGLNPDPKTTDLANRARITAVQKFLRDGIYASQQQAGKKMTPEEITDYVDQQFSRRTVTDHYWNANRPTMGMSTGDLTSDVSKAIRARLVAEGNAQPSDGDIMNRYWTVTNGKH